MKKVLLLITCLLFTYCLNAQTQNSLTMDGSNDYVTTTYAPPSGNVARTIEAWIKTTANSVPSAGGRQQVIADFGSFTTGGRFTFNVLFNNAIRLEVGGSGVNGNIPINNGNWHHVAVVYDPSNSAGTVTLYVDGNLDVQGTPTVTVNTGTSNNLIIGRRVDGINNFTGSIDEVRFWNTALSQNDLIIGGGSEICPSITGLTAYFQCNKGMANSNNSGLNILPELVNGNDGTLIGFSLSGATSNWTPGAPVNQFLTTDVSLNAGVLTAAQTGASYQWIDCATNMAISGATGMTFTPSITGNYAVEITNAGCAQISECTTITVLSEESYALFNLQLARNPSNQLFLNTSDLSQFTGTITDLSGKLVFSDALQNLAEKSNTLTAGLYLIKIMDNDNRSKLLKWVKE